MVVSPLWNTCPLQASEAFGNLIGSSGREPATGGRSSSSGSESETSSGGSGIVSYASAVLALREDYSKNYFVTGLGDMEAYAESCVFSDPFASFKGLDRFQRNVGNLGGLM